MESSANYYAKQSYLFRFLVGIVFFGLMTKFLHWGYINQGVETELLRVLLLFFVGIPWVISIFKLPGELMMLYGILTSKNAALDVQYVDSMRVSGKL